MSEADLTENPEPVFAQNNAGNSVTVRAPGKINVSFHVGPKRDDGYHLVASAYLAVSLYEDVKVTSKPGTPSDEISVSISQLSTLDDHKLQGIPLDASNLVVRAAKLLAGLAPLASGVHIEITKRVPIAGGMGGGSADAAATLLACDALWRTHLSREELAKLGAELGADVPFALLGGAAVGLGIGDQLTAALAPKALHWVLVESDFGLSTPVVFAKLDELRAGNEPAAPQDIDPHILQALRAGDAEDLADHLSNDLQEAAVALAPGLADVMQHGKEFGALTALVSGSGPTIAMLARSAQHAGELRQRMHDAGFLATAVEGPVHGAQKISNT